MKPASQKPLVIFGAGSFAQALASLILDSSQRDVVAYVVDDNYFQDHPNSGFELVPFSLMPEKYPAKDIDVIIALGYGAINRNRRERFVELSRLGYALPGFIHVSSILPPSFECKNNVLIYERAVIQPYALLGDNVFIRSGANIGHHSEVGDHTFIASGVVTGGNVTIGEQCFIGLGAVIRDNINIADRCFIGAGAVVINDTEPDSVYVGNPARRLDKTSLEVTS